MPKIFVSEKDNLERIGETKGADLESDHTQTPLSAYRYLPKNFEFLTQDSKEKAVLFLRRHPITNVGAIATVILLFLAPTIFGSLPVFDTLASNYRTVFSLLWYLIAIAYTYEKFLDWFFSVFIVTDERVIDVDFVNLIYREISSADLEKIQDITVHSGGAVMALFNYGDVFIQTAAEVENIEFEKVPKPDKVAGIIRNLMLQKK